MTSLGTVFTNQMAGLCAKNPDVIYFAGRGRDLAKFPAPPAKTHCAEKPLTVLTGDDASQVLQVNGADEVKQALRDSHIKLVFTGLAHPGAWATDPVAFNQATVAPFRTGGTFDTSFSDEQRDDGQAITGYDCVLTAVHTIRLGNSSQVTGSDVLGEIHALPGQDIAGASGWISVLNDASPDNKAIPIVRINGDGTTQTLKVTSRSGTPAGSSSAQK
jgi:hypothetical protein